MTKTNRFIASCALFALFTAGVAVAKQTAKVYCTHSHYNIDAGINTQIERDAKALRMGVKSISKPSFEKSGAVCVSVLFGDASELIH